MIITTLCSVRDKPLCWQSSMDFNEFTYGTGDNDNALLSRSKALCWHSGLDLTKFTYGDDAFARAFNLAQIRVATASDFAIVC